MTTQSPTIRDLLGMADDELAAVDPVVMNLVVAKGIPSLADLDTDRYVGLADAWGGNLLDRLPSLEANFHQAPQDWNNDLALYRLGLVCWYIDVVLGISYREDQRNATRILYTDPSDLFLNGVMDTRRGTCGNLALLNVVLCRRIGLPVSLACVGSHLLCRYDDGLTTHNIEATEMGRGGFSSQTDEYILNKHKQPAKAQSCGSDLRAVTPREMLGLFVAGRARHLENTCRLAESEPDYLLARYLFPRSRCLYIAQNRISVQCSTDRFEEGEVGHPLELAAWLREYVISAPWQHSTNPPQILVIQEKPNERRVDAIFQQAQVFVGANVAPPTQRQSNGVRR